MADGIRLESAIRYVQSGGCRGGGVVACTELVPRFLPSPLSALVPQMRWLKVRTVDPIFFPLKQCFLERFDLASVSSAVSATSDAFVSPSWFLC